MADAKVSQMTVTLGEEAGSSPARFKLQDGGNQMKIKQQQHQRQQRASVLAPKLKYESNFAQRDIEEIRRLVRSDLLEATKQLESITSSLANSPLNGDQDVKQSSHSPEDFERMMLDDWIVSRFLIRGFKAQGCEIPSCLDINNNDTTGNSCSENPNLDCAYRETINLIRACHRFRLKFRISSKTQLSEFPLAWTKLEGIFSFKQDLVGNPVLYMRCKLHRPKLIEHPDSRFQFKRLLLYQLDRCDRDLFNKPGKAICCVFDMSEATLDNFDRELITWMISSFKSASPKLLTYVMIYNLPWFLSATFKLITSNLLSRTSKPNLRFVYGKEIVNYIGYEDLPDYIRWKLDDY